MRPHHLQEDHASVRRVSAGATGNARRRPQRYCLQTVTADIGMCSKIVPCPALSSSAGRPGSPMCVAKPPTKQPNVQTQRAAGPFADASLRTASPGTQNQAALAGNTTRAKLTSVAAWGGALLSERSRAAPATSENRTPGLTTLRCALQCIPVISRRSFLFVDLLACLCVFRKGEEGQNQDRESKHYPDDIAFNLCINTFILQKILLQMHDDPWFPERDMYSHKRRLLVGDCPLIPASPHTHASFFLKLVNMLQISI